MKMINKNMEEIFSRIKDEIINAKNSLDRQLSKSKPTKYFFKIFNNTFSDSCCKEYFKAISYIHSIFEQELETNSVFNETFQSKYINHHVIII